MSGILRWPDGFADPTPDEFDSNFVLFLGELRASDTTITAESGWGLFEFARADRSIYFIRRGRHGAGRINREMYWEVVPVEDGVARRLGSMFGIRENACVVVCGVPHIRLLSMRWLDGLPLTDVVRGITLWDRCDPSAPFVLTGDQSIA